MPIPGQNRTFHVKVKDKATDKEHEIQVVGNFDEEGAKAHVANSPGSIGGHHPGFEVLGVEEK